MNETYDLGGVDYADELATIYECKACGYKEVRGWAYTDADTDDDTDDDIPF